ncbi:MAG: uL15 family ribosomal protein [bacterium]|nr:uL15 family ribosomal protein [bacterium]
MIHEIKPVSPKVKKHRIGRGGKRGTTSGHGQKGQRSRSGHRIRPAERDLISRIPKRRGLKHKPVSVKNFLLDLNSLSKLAETNSIDKKFLVEKKLIGNIRQPVKILAVGTITKAINVSGFKVSKAAQEKIEKAGGSVK